jgi:alpha-glucuronidase
MSSAYAEDGSAAWLRYSRVRHVERFNDIPHRIVVLEDDAVSLNASNELAIGLRAELGGEFVVEHALDSGSAIVMRIKPAVGRRVGDSLLKESFHIRRMDRAGIHRVMLDGGSPAGLLYGVFQLLEDVEVGGDIVESAAPRSVIRWTDEWDNLDGSIERGYAGRSIFFENGHVRRDLTRAREYARLLASVGINGCNVNNVNADLEMLSTEHLSEVARLAEALRPWAVRVALSVDLSSPQSVGGLKTFDPLDPTVVLWWRRKIDEIYSLIPDFAGFTVKADSEGRPGPSQYGRSPADAANVLARALQPHKGVVLYRGFVYNHHLDWNDLKADRARAGYDNFAKYDGKFEPNVIIQIKHGPIDFQAREPVSPLFGALRQTSQAIELQTTQEYTGQQRHMVFLPSMWKWVVDTDMRVQDKPSTVGDIVTGRRFHQPFGGFVSVANVGLEANWLHHPMALANLYGFAKLAWDPGVNLDAILDRWTRLTWGDDPETVTTITEMLRGSWQTYENYTGPNGMGTLTNILGVHFGAGIESAERNGWGQWFRGDRQGIGMDRTVATGTGYVGQYPPQLAKRYESLETCPDDLLLFFHHVPYTHKLHTGKTLVQSIYDAHYDGTLSAAHYVESWEGLKGKIDDERFNLVDQLLTYQAGHAIVWRDAINTWFLRESGVQDISHRVEHDPNRFEAEDMKAIGYVPKDIAPFETASGGKAVVCERLNGCTLSMVISLPTGKYNIAVQYFDLRTGISHYALELNGHPIASWESADTLPPAVVWTHMDGQTSTRFTFRGVELHPGDMLSLIGIPDLSVRDVRSEDSAGNSRNASPDLDKRELAPVDYLEFGPSGPVTPQ